MIVATTRTMDQCYRLYLSVTPSPYSASSFAHPTHFIFSSLCPSHFRYGDFIMCIVSQSHRGWSLPLLRPEKPRSRSIKMESWKVTKRSTLSQNGNMGNCNWHTNKQKKIRRQRVIRREKDAAEERRAAHKHDYILYAFRNI